MLKDELKISTISIPRKAWFCDPSLYHFLQKAPNLGQIGCFFSYIFQNTPNFANWAHWVCDDNPPIDIPKLTKMHLKTFEHPRQWEPPRGAKWKNLPDFGLFFPMFPLFLDFFPFSLSFSRFFPVFPWFLTIFLLSRGALYPPCSYTGYATEGGGTELLTSCLEALSPPGYAWVALLSTGAM